MKAFFRNKIRSRLKGYKMQFNEVDVTLPLNNDIRKKVAVIGGGIAGISAAANLCERNFEVTVFEKNDYIGGKLGSWNFESHGEKLRAEHGFHAFFRQYYNLRRFMKKLGIDRHLVPIDDYVILYQNGKRQGFKDIDPTPGLNILDLRKSGVFNWLTYINPLSAYYLSLLRFHPEKTFRDFDDLSFAQFAKRSLMPANMQLVFTSFARAFFAEPEKISMAELIKGFHFYFLSNDDGLLYDVLDDDFEHTFLKPCLDHLQKNKVQVCMSREVNRIGFDGKLFEVEGSKFYHVVLSLDAKHVGTLVANSKNLIPFKKFCGEIEQLRCTDRYAVYRIWTDTFESQSGLPFFVFTDRLQCLDSVTFYHAMEKESAAWSKINGGGIFELHCYSLPDDLQEDATIKKQMLEELFHFFPELKNMQIRHEYFQHKDDFPAFHVGQNKHRPAVKTEVPGLYLAGDWVKLPVPAMLMEAAYTSGAIAANHILRSENLQENILETVSPYGLFRSA